MTDGSLGTPEAISPIVCSIITRPVTSRKILCGSNVGKACIAIHLGIPVLLMPSYNRVIRYTGLFSLSVKGKLVSSLDKIDGIHRLFLDTPLLFGGLGSIVFGHLLLHVSLNCTTGENIPIGNTITFLPSSVRHTGGPS